MDVAIRKICFLMVNCLFGHFLFSVENKTGTFPKESHIKQNGEARCVSGLFLFRAGTATL